MDIIIKVTGNNTKHTFLILFHQNNFCGTLVFYTVFYEFNLLIKNTEGSVKLFTLLFTFCQQIATSLKDQKHPNPDRSHVLHAMFFQNVSNCHVHMHVTVLLSMTLTSIVNIQSQEKVFGIGTVCSFLHILVI